MARVKRYNSETGQWEYCNTGGMPIKGIDYLTRADYDTMRADIDAYLERNKESVGVTVSGNQGAEDVYGASVRVVGEDGSVLEEKAWGGSELVFRMEAGTVYHVEVDASLQGFSNYKSETFTAAKGGARTVTADVYAEKVNVSVEGIDSGFTVTVKEEYTPCEYIESTGEQYIDTGFKPNNNTRVVMDFEMTSTPSASSSIFGARYSSSADMYNLMWHANGYYRSDYNKTASQQWAVTATGRRTVDKNRETTTVDGVTNSYTNASFSVSHNLYLCCLNNAGTTLWGSSMRIYSCQIYDNGTLVRDYTPVMNSSGVYGLYDKVNGVFYSSATSAEFAGPSTEQNTFLTLTETSGSCLVPYGTAYSVSATAVDGYASPTSQTFTANVDSRNVVMVYEENLLGVFVEDINGKLWKTDDWDESVRANGVAVCTENCRFVMGLILHGYNYWSNTYALVTGIVSTTDINVASTDYRGKENTQAILATHPDDTLIASLMSYNYEFPNGQSGYLGSAGEWCAVCDNYSEIHAAYSLLGLSFYMEESRYWTSTQYSETTAWYCKPQDQIYAIDKRIASTYSMPFTTLKRDTESVNMITFYIPNGNNQTIPYQAEEGMTWAQWIDSEYNTVTDVIYVDASSGYVHYQSKIGAVLYILNAQGTDTIIAGKTYTLN